MKPFATFLLLALAAFAPATAQEPVDLVNPLMGTDNTYELSSGNTYPAIARPFGMNFWTPQTGKMGDGWQYTYHATKIRGFKQTHQPSPWINDYGQFSVFPVAGTPQFDEEKRQSWFSHKSETVSPYYYSVYLADYDILTELTPTSRSCMFRVHYPQNEPAWFIVDAFDCGSKIVVDTLRRTVSGYSSRNSGGVPQGFRSYFVMTFNCDLQDCIVLDKGQAIDGQTSVEGEHAGCMVRLSLPSTRELIVRVASSFVSEAQAWRNLQENEGQNFDEMVENGRQEWNEMLSKIEVDDPSLQAKQTFYSCLYRCLLFPRCFFEIGADGQPLHYSPYNGQVASGYMYTDTGFWDTFRSLFPLLNLVYPTVARQMQEGFLNAYRESGFLPEWASPGHRDCMVGNNSASVMADAWLKGVRVADSQTLWEAVVHGAEAEHPTVSSTGRKGFALYNQLGYVPYDSGIRENVARTLEYAYDDWCIYRLGQSLGKSENELQPFKKRALNYQKVFDKSTRLMRGRNADGTWQSPFNPLKWGDAFTEGNAWHWTWCVFHDPAGLIGLMGGEQQFNQMMDSVFHLPPLFDDSYYGFTIHEIREMQLMNLGNYAHGNQPIQHMIYLYNYSGEPWKTQERVREVMRRFYTPTPDGYCGDEDNGQTSAWYVFSALGFYPVCPASNQYVLGSPLFRRATIHLENGKSISLNAEGNNAHNVYIDAMALNGKKWNKNYLDHETLTHGADVHFTLSDKANRRRGTAKADRPYSFSRSADCLK